MTEVNVRQLKELRARTGAGVMECRHALEEANGHMEQAEEWLRHKAIEEAARRGEREMGEGWITSYLHHNGKLGALVEMRCETDFVARTEAFRTLAQKVAEHVAASDATVVELLMEQPWIRAPERTIADLVKETAGLLGERVAIRRFARFRLGEE
jgi:elongation factor Ts